jgi:hypothetical protein
MNLFVQNISVVYGALWDFAIDLLEKDVLQSECKWF